MVSQDTLKNYFERLRMSEAIGHKEVRISTYKYLIRFIHDKEQLKKFKTEIPSKYNIESLIKHIKKNVELEADILEEFNEVCSDYKESVIKEEYLEDLIENLSRDFDFYGQPV